MCPPDAAGGVSLSIKHRIRCLTLGLTLWAGALNGVPMPPERIQELLQQMNQPKIAHVLREEADTADDADDLE